MNLRNTTDAAAVLAGRRLTPALFLVFLLCGLSGCSAPDNPTSPTGPGSEAPGGSGTGMVSGSGGSTAATGGVSGAGVGGGSAGTPASAGAAGQGSVDNEPPDLKPRVLVLTDISNEPDDEQSMVRFLVYSNRFDVEGLLATTSQWLKNSVRPERIVERIQAYGEVRPNLMLHAEGWQTPQALLDRVKSCLPVFGMAGVGEGKDSDGSDWIISVVDAQDPRPVWVTGWGGSNCLAQALYKVQHTRTAAQLAEFVAKLRVYTISDQDDSGPWLRKTFPELFYIASPGEGGYEKATWSGISGEKWYKFSTGTDFSTVDNPWLDANVRNEHGPLGALHAQTAYIMEGDTPSFLYLIPNGLGSPEHPDWGSWGGRYERYLPATQPWFREPETRPLWTDAADRVIGNDAVAYLNNQATIWRWRDAYQADFAARMDWNVKPFAEANHNPVAIVNGSDRRREIALIAAPGASVALDASESMDPDGDALEFSWSTSNTKEASRIRRVPKGPGDCGPRARVMSTPRDRARRRRRASPFSPSVQRLRLPSGNCGAVQNWVSHSK